MGGIIQVAPPLSGVASTALDASNALMRPNLGWLFLLCLLSGCAPELETGYKPKPLNATEADRRSYYAPQFSAEAHAEKDESGPGLQFAH
jgi:hypothetical protein